MELAFSSLKRKAKVVGKKKGSKTVVIDEDIEGLGEEQTEDDEEERDEEDE
jgi:hypothetical protein